mmetsp:Transcript_22741/g.64443  ORF Transcript_22741/g.64443 Transcript_22741/m.64443 type:complete len:352 (-) Transcript_22741:66-1121(-)
MAEGPRGPTPPEVLAGLQLAFGSDKVGETGYEIAAATCTSEAEKQEARERGSSLLYGELLPDGVSKALLPDWLGGALVHRGGGGLVLELGMGSGKVALQIFLQCRSVAHVLGIELVPSRYAIAEAALLRLAGTHPQAFRTLQSEPGARLVLEECASGRKVEIRCADFFSLGLDLTERSDIIFFAVNVPCKLFPQLCQRLSRAKEGCRLFTYHALDAIWWISEPCPFQHCEANVPESDTFSTSWSPQGYRFFVYVCDRSRPPQITAESRNETYTEWQAIWDEASQSYYYHNQESEHSQWEVPHAAGCWRAEWSQEHGAYFFWHAPSGHSQWEVPKCLADLGWGTGTDSGSAG